MFEGYNATPQAELQGLSPNQLAALLDGDWRTKGAVRLNQALPGELANQAWAFRAALDFLRLVRDHGPAPTTATGNLSRKFVAEALNAIEFPPGHLDYVRTYCKVINEPDVGLLHELRITLVNAGFLRRQRGFRITRPGREALEAATTRPGPLFTRLFLAQMGVPGAFLEPDGPTFRSPVGPALFLLRFLAADWVDSLWLTDRLLVPHLFPDLTPMQLGFSAYQWVVAPCLAFGLAEQREDLTRGGLSSVRITPLFGQFIEFVFPDAGEGRGHLRLVR